MPKRHEERLLIFSFLTKKMHKTTTWSGGHGDSVLSLDVNKEGILASGGEDCLCVWSKDGSPMTRVRPSGETNEVTSVCFCQRSPEKLFVSSGTKVYGYDLRNLGNPVCEFDVNNDEINQVVVHERGQYLSACDDTGVIKVIDLQGNKLYKTLSRSHTNICSTVQFRSRRPWELVSGGMDFKIVCWDFSSGRVTQEVNMQELVAGDEGEAYFINPPFVHSIHAANDCAKFAAGLGDGSIQTFYFKEKKKFVPHERLKKHKQGVSQVHFPHFEPSANMLVSGSNDKRILLWKLGNRQDVNGHQENRNNGATAVMGTTESIVIQEVEHGSKVNWITSSFGGNKLVYIADQTDQITLYEVLG